MSVKYEEVDVHRYQTCEEAQTHLQTFRRMSTLPNASIRL